MTLRNLERVRDAALSFTGVMPDGLMVAPDVFAFLHAEWERDQMIGTPEVHGVRLTVNKYLPVGCYVWTSGGKVMLRTEGA